MSSYIYILSISNIGQAEPCCDKDVSAQLTSTHHKPGDQAAKMAGSMASKPMHQTIPHGTLCGTTKWLWFLQVRNRSTQQWYSDSIGRKDPQASAICINVNVHIFCLIGQTFASTPAKSASSLRSAVISRNFWSTLGAVLWVVWGFETF